ncbi:MAG: hypothetical protein IJ629_04510 [Clostridia bacterium]|nr:hypothetical protein [Clostridia bacterium]
MAAGKKRNIKGFKKFGKEVAFKGGKYGLKALAKLSELGVRGGTRLVEALADSEQAQVIATTGGLIAASVAFPPVAIGVAGLVVGKMFADRVLGTRTMDGRRKNILDEVRETILLGNNITNLACTRVISPAMRFVNKKAEIIGKDVQTKIDDKFDGR